MNINEISEKAYNHAKKNGFFFNDPKYHIFLKLKEEVEEFKISDDGRIDLLEMTIKKFPDMFKSSFEANVKNSEGDELADIIITALSGAMELGIDIEKHIVAKLKYNEMREDHK